MMRNFFEMFLRARQALEFSHSQDPKADIGPIKIPQCSGPYPTVRLGLRLSNYLRPLTHELARRVDRRGDEARGMHESAYVGCKGDICERLPNNRDI